MSIQKKGITPVIAILFMVIITILLVAMAAVWFTGVMKGGQKKIESQQQALNRQFQKISIDRDELYANLSSNKVCFVIQASSTNTLSIPLSEVVFDVVSDNLHNKVIDSSGYAYDPSCGISITEVNCSDLKILNPGTMCRGTIKVTKGTLDCYLDVFVVKPKDEESGWAFTTEANIESCTE